MNLHDFDSVSPFVRTVKIKKSTNLTGDWEDFDHVLIYIASGQTTYVTPHGAYHLKTGDIILFPPYLYHEIISHENEHLVQYILHFDLFADPQRMRIPHQSARTLAAIAPLPECEKLFTNTAHIAVLPAEEQLPFERLFLQMYREFFQQQTGFEGMLRAMALQTIFCFLRYHQEECLPSEKPAESKPQRLVRCAQEYIWLHYGEALENAVIAEALDVSANYLTSIFRRCTGSSLHEYVTAYRIAQAQKMLAGGKYNITEISRKCGFSSVHTFSKLFRKKCGICPSAYAALPHQDAAPAVPASDYQPERRILYNQ